MAVAFVMVEVTGGGVRWRNKTTFGVKSEEGEGDRGPTHRGKEVLCHEAWRILDIITAVARDRLVEMKVHAVG